MRYSGFEVVAITMMYLLSDKDFNLSNYIYNYIIAV